MPRVFIPALAASLLLAAPALAQEGRPAEPEGKWAADRATIGLGGGIAPDYSGSDDYEFQPGGIVQGSVSGFSFAMRGTNLYVDLAREGRGADIDVIAGPVVQVRLERTGAVKDARVTALGELDAAFEAGGYFGLGKRGIFSRFDEVSADVTLVHDVGKVHKSYVIRPSIGYQTLLGKRTFTQLRASADFVGKGFARTYYDVPAGSLLPAYTTNGGGLESVGLTALATHGLGRDPRRGWSLFALGGWSRITGKFARSPIVSVAGDADQFRLIGGLGYTF
ncbi:MipA/OmpV family protein [Novosphingobium aquae]|uniref:MipA/OmpV family protein n=1 Tax=Novosphingobium aquae TaxID=3133435 RepID=A0ABU8SBE6_9SPHN